MTATTVMQTFIIRHGPCRAGIGRYYSTRRLYTNDVGVAKELVICGST